MERQEGLVAVVGLGQIGGSIARRLSAVGHEVIGVDPNAQVLAQAQEVGAIKVGFGHVEQIRSSVEAIFLASWPNSILDLLAHPARLPTTKLITDCASIKAPCEAACDPGISAFYVGGHPMAGNEGVGFASSRPDLFQGRAWALCPLTTSPSEAVDLAVHYVEALGAKPVVMSSEAHDREVALLSHLPNLLANLLAILGEDIEHPELAAGTWNGVTRVAGSIPDLWTEILRQNQENLGMRIDDLIALLQQARSKSEFESLWQRAAEIKNNQRW
ncbi:MAG: prephenate dehydrogenase/arogenate dehydrogenase family protein [Fimbriimonadaceae bacterium]|nr:prephenate dehydrogenase/arogenate dehydrogenase family protein [Fimbriimonadaceae bacterium]